MSKCKNRPTPTTEESKFMGCIEKKLPDHLQIRGALAATSIFPPNAPSSTIHAILPPERIALVTTKYWGPQLRTLTVSFMEDTPTDLQNRILAHMNAWTRTGCISFALTNGVGNVRISREPGGYWSYLGTDILQIPTSQQTMNLEEFTMDTPESEYHRVVRHETGHSLGYPHEHMRAELVNLLNVQRTIRYFMQTQGWSEEEVRQQVLTPLSDRSIMGTPADQTSIMCYQLPGEITENGRDIPGGLDINQSDYVFTGTVYPKAPANQELVRAVTDKEWYGS